MSTRRERKQVTNLLVRVISIMPESNRKKMLEMKKAEQTGSNHTVIYDGKEYKIQELIRNLDNWQPDELELPECDWGTIECDWELPECDWELPEMEIDLPDWE